MSIPQEDLMLLNKNTRRKYRKHEISENKIKKIIATIKNKEIATVVAQSIFNEFTDNGNAIDRQINYAIPKSDMIRWVKEWICDVIINESERIGITVSETTARPFTIADIPDPDINLASYIEYMIYKWNSDIIPIHMKLEIDLRRDIFVSMIDIIVCEFIDKLDEYNDDLKDLIVCNIIKLMHSKEFLDVNPIDINQAITELDKITIRSITSDIEELGEYLSICESVKKSRDATAKLISDIQAIKGNKIITITSDELDSSFDMNDAEIQNITEREFADRVTLHMFTGAGCIVRQFLSKTYTKTLSNGKTLDVPFKNIYGVQLMGDSYEWLPEEDVFESHMTDHRTGYLMEKEHGVDFCGYYQDVISHT